ncbi:efflux RND transporter permease subunit, partial [Candidatus Fermentibacterales bacterium]|nr:efflux RND transporter permease subunit [Candidatus Fermentibacterales bacterium]
MSLPGLSVRRRITFIMVFIFVLGVGLFGLTQLGVDLYPDLQFPMIFMVSQLQGAGAEEMETLVTDILEEAAARVKNVRKVSSSSSPGISSVIAEFSWGYDLNQAETDLRRVLDLYEDFLPEDASKPFVLALDPSAQPVMFISFTSDVLNDFDLREMVEEEIEPLINRIDGVGSTMTQGGLERQIRVEVDPVRLAESGVSLTAVVGALGAVRNDQPAGAVEAGGMKINVRVESAYHSVEEIEQLVVGYGPGGPVMLRDVSEVYDGTMEIVDHVRVDGKSAVILFIMKRSDANTVNVCRAVSAELGDISGRYAGLFDLFVLWDQSEFITDSIGNLSQTAVQAFIIAVLVLLFFLRSWRSSIIVGISIPLSVVATFAVMYFFEVDINFISLAGLALAVGMLVDNSIVVLESIFRYRESGEAGPDASVKGSMEVGMAITASTLTTLAVFVPILFVPGLSGQLFRDMSLTISFSLLVSLFVALSLVPLLTSRAKKLEPRKGRLAALIGGRIDAINSRYNRAVTWTVGHRKLVIWSTIGLFVLSLLMLRFVPTDF